MAGNIPGDTSSSFLASFYQGLNYSHQREQDKRLEQQAQIANTMNMMKMQELAQAMAFDNEVHNNPDLRKAVASQFEDPEAAEKTFASGIKFSQAKSVLPLKQPNKPPATLENILAENVRTGKMTLQEAYLAKQQNKEFNVPADVDTFLMGKFKGYASDPKVRQQASDWYSTPEGQKSYDSWWTTRKQTGPTVITYLTGPNGEYYPAPTRGGGLPPPNQPVRTPGGAPIQKPVSNEQLSKIADLLTLESNVNAIETNFDKSYVGPVAGRLGSAKEQLVELPEKQVTFYAATRDAQDALLRARSGAQINEQEYARLIKFLPDPNLPSANFIARLKRFKGELRATIANKKAMLSQGGAVNIPTPAPTTDNQQGVSDPLGIR